jgi:hypothetical protein
MSLKNLYKKVSISEKTCGNILKHTL